jgi:molecular chaperone DnaK (HSP70)
MSSGVVKKIVTRYSVLLRRKSRMFSTTTDNKTSLKIRLYAGERALASDNIFLDTLVLEGIKPAPAGDPKIEVTLELNASPLIKQILEYARLLTDPL